MPFLNLVFCTYRKKLVNFKSYFLLCKTNPVKSAGTPVKFDKLTKSRHISCTCQNQKNINSFSMQSYKTRKYHTLFKSRTITERNHAIQISDCEIKSSEKHPVCMWSCMQELHHKLSASKSAHVHLTCMLGQGMQNEVSVAISIPVDTPGVEYREVYTDSHCQITHQPRYLSAS